MHHAISKSYNVTAPTRPAREKIIIHLGMAQISSNNPSLPHAAAPRAQLVPHDNILRVVQAWQGSGRYLGRYGKFSHFFSGK